MKGKAMSVEEIKKLTDLLQEALDKGASLTEQDTSYVAYVFFSTLGSLIYQFDGKQKLEAYVKRIMATTEIQENKENQKNEPQIH